MTRRGAVRSTTLAAYTRMEELVIPVELEIW